MRIIGVLSTKGGVGKTTLTICLAVEAVANGQEVAVCDLDPQLNYSDWYERRGSPDNPALLTGETRASDAIEAIKLNCHYNYVFLDGPPGALRVTEDAAKSSDFVLIPLRASGLDITASQDAAEICRENGKPFLLVINARTQHEGKLVDEARRALTAFGYPVAETVIPHRLAYITALPKGKAGQEADRKAADDIKALWAEVRAAMNKGAK